MKRISLAAAATLAAALAVALMPGAAAGTSTSTSTTNLSCNDGTNLNLALNATALSALSSAVSAINLYPAGDPALACSLRQLFSASSMQTLSSPRTFSSPRMFSSFRTFSSGWSPTAAGGNGGNPNTDYAVGGGRAALLCGENNFALNARVDDTSNGSAGTGTFNLTIPQSACPFAPEGHFNAKIDCVSVGTNGTAQATANVTHATGSLSSYDGTEIEIDVLDSGLPGGTGDMIGLSGRATQCQFSGSANTAVDKGNINVHHVP